MGFERPLFLAGLICAALPLLIHLWNRRRLVRVPFSSLFFVRSLRRERFNWLRLRDIILLVLRTLAIASLFLALARPWVRLAAPRVLAGTGAVIVLDDSYSMSWGHDFARARELVGAVVESVNPRSPIALVRSSAPGTARFTSADRVRAALDTIAPGFRAPTLAGAWARAVLLARPPGEPALPIFVVSDLQERAWRPLLAGTTTDARAWVLPVGARTRANCTVAAVTFADAGAGVAVDIVNHGTREERRTLRLELGARSSLDSLDLPARGRRRVQLGPALSPSEVSTGLVELDPDSLAADDRRYAVLTGSRTLSVLVVAEPSAELLVKALAPAPELGFTVEAVRPADVRRLDLARFDVISLVNPVDLGADLEARLARFRAAGGALLVFLEDPPRRAPAFLEPVHVQSRVDVAGFVAVRALDRSPPLFGRGLDLSRVRVFRYARLVPGTARVVTHVSDGSPFVLFAEPGLAVIACRPDPTATDWVYQASFVPFLHRLVRVLAAGGERSEYLVGDTVRIINPALRPVDVRGPGGTTRLLPAVYDGQRELRYAGTDRPGLYDFDGWVCAVNVDPDEGDLTRIDERTLRRAGFEVGTPAARRFPLASALYLLAVLCVIAELGLIVRG